MRHTRLHQTMGARWYLWGAVVVGCLGLSSGSPADADVVHPWLGSGGQQTLAQRLSPPAGFVRRPAEVGSFARWLRQLPMKPKGAGVYLHNGLLKPRQDVHTDVVDIDIGRRDLQQCADAVMRLRAEWQLASGRVGQIGFKYTGGGRVTFARWAQGWRPNAKGTRWSRRGRADNSYPSFRRYMRHVFAYAGTYSLSRELKRVDRQALGIGDVFIKGGFPGHAVLVVDMVQNPATGEKRFALAQSYMPAQNIHILKNPQDRNGGPWYPATFSWPLVTPEWTFHLGSLKRWP